MPSSDTSPPSRAGRGVERPTRTKKNITVYIDAEIHDEAKVAVVATRHLRDPGGHENLSQLVETLLADWLSTTRTAFHDGKPFSRTGPTPGRGRPLR